MDVTPNLQPWLSFSVHPRLPCCRYVAAIIGLKWRNCRHYLQPFYPIREFGFLGNKGMHPAHVLRLNLAIVGVCFAIQQHRPSFVVPLMPTRGKQNTYYKRRRADVRKMTNARHLQLQLTGQSTILGVFPTSVGSQPCNVIPPSFGG